MASRVFVDGYMVVTFTDEKGSAMLYIEEGIFIPFFQIDILENFFHRMLSYCDNNDNNNDIDIVVSKLKNGNINVNGFFNNENQDYDFRSNAENALMILHSAFSTLLDISINSGEGRLSIDEQEEISEGEFSEATEEEMEKIGEVIDKALDHCEELPPEDE